MIPEEKIAILKQEFEDICQRIFKYIEKIKVKRPFKVDNLWDIPHDFDVSEWYSQSVSEKGRREAKILSENISRVAKDLSSAASKSLLIDDADILDMRLSLKRIRSALFLRKYHFWEAEVIHDEGTVLGINPANQSDNTPVDSTEALKIVHKSQKRILDIVDLISPTESPYSSLTSNQEVQRVSRFRQNTAFIMMQIDYKIHELDDVLEGIKETFSSFDIKAVRADEIEHEDMITKRILDEIATSEFLIADLTGSRPSVYYEVGYAHAIGKRVILYRKEGTKLHFDLAIHNCPEYKNVKDLKEKLKKRLKSMTNKEQ